MARRPRPASPPPAAAPAQQPEEPLRTTPEGDPAPGLARLPRAELDSLEQVVPGFVDRLVSGAVVLTRHGEDAYVVLPLDAWRRIWAALPRRPVLEGEPEA